MKNAEDIRTAADRLFEEKFRAAGWTDEDFKSYAGWGIREGVVAIAIGGEVAAMRQIAGEHSLAAIPRYDPATGQVTESPLVNRCMEVIREARNDSAS